MSNVLLAFFGAIDTAPVYCKRLENFCTKVDTEVLMGAFCAVDTLFHYMLKDDMLIQSSRDKYFVLYRRTRHVPTETHYLGVGVYSKKEFLIESINNSMNDLFKNFLTYYQKYTLQNYNQTDLEACFKMDFFFDKVSKNLQSELEKFEE